MREAVSKLSVRPQILLNDAVTIPALEIPPGAHCQGGFQELVHSRSQCNREGDEDRLMREADRLMPEYGFAGHKGYGSAAHIEAIRRFGPSPIHRKTFIRNFMDK